MPVFKDISVSHTLELFDKLIFPILIYEGEVWGFSEAQALEKIDTRFCKQVLNVKLQTPNNFIYGELGRLPLKELRLLYIIKFWLKITRADDRKYIERMYNHLLYDADYSTNRNNWASKVKKNLLQTTGFTYVWLNQGVENVSVFKNDFAQRIKDIYIQDWDEQLNKLTRSSTYKAIRSFTFHPYLDTIKLKKTRTSISKIRLSSHRLEIEIGRWTKPKAQRSDRKCRLYNIPEDEYHFILECPLYLDLRKVYIKKKKTLLVKAQHAKID